MGKNMYIQNPFSDKNGTKLCVDSVYVNGKPITDKIHSTAFEINLAEIGLVNGDSLEIVLFHNSDCLPKVLNPDLGPRIGNFKVENIQIKGNTLIWKTSEEGGKLPIIIEQYRWNKWVKVGEVDGQGLKEGNEYQFPITLITGENKFRVKQVGLDRRPRVSSLAKATHPTRKKSIGFDHSPENKTIQFEEITRYELFDAYGHMVDTGESNLIDLDKRQKGLYYLNYDNVVGTKIIVE